LSKIWVPTELRESYSLKSKYEKKMKDSISVHLIIIITFKQYLGAYSFTI